MFLPYCYYVYSLTCTPEVQSFSFPAFLLSLRILDVMECSLVHPFAQKDIPDVRTYIPSQCKSGIRGEGILLGIVHSFSGFALQPWQP